MSVSRAARRGGTPQQVRRRWIEQIHATALAVRERERWRSRADRLLAVAVAVVSMQKAAPSVLKLGDGTLPTQMAKLLDRVEQAIEVTTTVEANGDLHRSADWRPGMAAGVLAELELFEWQHSARAAPPQEEGKGPFFPLPSGEQADEIKLATVAKTLCELLRD